MKQYLKLLLAREAKEVLGKKGTNLWLLTLVLVATFACIAFSEGSQDFLRYKMEDPFTNWVSIDKAVDDISFNRFRDSLMLEDNKIRFGYENVLMDQYNNYSIQGTDTGAIHYLSVRFFESINTNLINAVLKDENLIEGCIPNSSTLIENTLGFIITMKAAEDLGFTKDHLPAYINYLHGIREEDLTMVDLDSLGIDLIEDQFCRVPVPVLAIVKKLPGNMDLMSANFFYEQQHNNDRTHPFDVVGHNSTYLHSLYYWVSEEVGIQAFDSFARSIKLDSIDIQIYEDPRLKDLQSWKPGKMLKIDLGGEQLPLKIFNVVAEAISKQFTHEQVQRVYRLDTQDFPSERSSFISIEFNSLAHIREFETYAKEMGITLDMAQVASKENFNTVTVIARILSTAMVIFAIICIIMFLVNMLQSYFQKVKRNIGTFKAFGMNSKELIKVYVILLVAIVFAGIALALMITWGVQEILPLRSVEGQGFKYLELWNMTTFIATLVIFASTVITVIVVMTRLLSQTPGDLIYDRD